MAHELVGVAQAVVVEHAELVEDDGVVHRTAKAEVALAHELQVAHEAEGACAADLADVVPGRELHHRTRLRGGDRGMVELDGEVEPEAVIRLEARDLVAVAHLDVALDADEALGGILQHDPGRLQQEHERTRRAVHDRYLGRRQLDEDVVHAQPGQCRHQVFDRHHLARTTGQPGAEHGLGDEFAVGGNFHHRIEVDAAEHDAGIDRRRTQRQEDLLATVQAYAGGADGVLEGALLGHQGSARSAGTRWANAERAKVSTRPA